MPKSSVSPRTTHRSFTVRVPIGLYLEMGQLAQEEETNLNQKVNQLLMLGMGKHISLNNALRNLLAKEMTNDE